MHFKYIFFFYDFIWERQIIRSFEGTYTIYVFASFTYKNFIYIEQLALMNVELCVQKSWKGNLLSCDCNCNVKLFFTNIFKQNLKFQNDQVYVL